MLKILLGVVGAIVLAVWMFWQGIKFGIDWFLSFFSGKMGNLK